MPDTINEDIRSDVFTEKKEVKTSFKPVGKSGTLVTASQVENDYLNNLLGIDGQIEFSKMLLSDSTIRKLVHAVNNPIKSAQWDIEPASDDPKDIEVAALIKEIIFKNSPDGFVAKLDEILTFPWHGHCVMEPVHKNYIDKNFGPYTGLKNLAFRDQRTLDKWNFDSDGVLLSVHQIQNGDIPVNVDIPAENLLFFFNEKKGNDTGYAFCRMLYGNYKRKLLYKQLQAIGIERGAVGVPLLTLPPGVEFDSDEYNSAIEQLSAFTQAETSYMVMPDGYIVVVDQSNTFDPAKVQVAIKAENEEIAGSLVAMWLEMGIGGNSAVGSSTGISADFFRDGIEYLADKTADPFNLKLIPSLVKLNYGEDVGVMPKLVHSGIADEAGEELMRVITGYTKEGVVTPDEQLEDHVRKSHNLPKKAEGEMMDNQEAQDDDRDDRGDLLDDNNNSVDGDNSEIELSEKIPKTPRSLISGQAVKISEEIRSAIKFSSAKYINDVMNRYRQLPESKKQNATSKVKMGGGNSLKKELRRSLTETMSLAIEMARKEVPLKKDIELNNHERDMIRMTEKFGDITEIKLNDFSKLPAYGQVLVQKQSELISEASMADLKSRLDFSFSSIETKSADENIIRQSMEDDAEKFANSNQVNTKGVNSSSLMVNEGRDAFFFEPDVLEEISSFTFMNIAPKSAICRELTGTTFNTNDAESLRYTPPLHHNCKSFLRANLKVSRGVSSLEVSTLAPSSEAKKTITL